MPTSILLGGPSILKPKLIPLGTTKTVEFIRKLHVHDMYNHQVVCFWLLLLYNGGRQYLKCVGTFKYCPLSLGSEEYLNQSCKYQGSN